MDMSELKEQDQEQSRPRRSAQLRETGQRSRMRQVLCRRTGRYQR